MSAHLGKRTGLYWVTLERFLTAQLSKSEFDQILYQLFPPDKCKTHTLSDPHSYIFITLVLSLICHVMFVYSNDICVSFDAYSLCQSYKHKYITTLITLPPHPILLVCLHNSMLQAILYNVNSGLLPSKLPRRKINTKRSGGQSKQTNNRGKQKDKNTDSNTTPRKRKKSDKNHPHNNNGFGEDGLKLAGISEHGDEDREEGSENRAGGHGHGKHKGVAIMVNMERR